MSTTRSSRAEYNENHDHCTGTLLKYLNRSPKGPRERKLDAWIAALVTLRGVGLDMEVPIGKVLASLKSYERITTHKKYHDEIEKTRKHN